MEDHWRLMPHGQISMYNLEAWLRVVRIHGLPMFRPIRIGVGSTHCVRDGSGFGNV